MLAIISSIRVYLSSPSSFILSMTEFTPRIRRPTELVIVCRKKQSSHPFFRVTFHLVLPLFLRSSPFFVWLKLNGLQLSHSWWTLYYWKQREERLERSRCPWWRYHKWEPSRVSCDFFPSLLEAGQRRSMIWSKCGHLRRSRRISSREQEEFKDARWWDGALREDYGLTLRALGFESTDPLFDHCGSLFFCIGSLCFLNCAILVANVIDDCVDPLRGLVSLQELRPRKPKMRLPFHKAKKSLHEQVKGSLSTRVSRATMDSWCEYSQKELLDEKKEPAGSRGSGMGDLRRAVLFAGRLTQEKVREECPRVIKCGKVYGHCAMRCECFWAKRRQRASWLEPCKCMRSMCDCTLWQQVKTSLWHNCAWEKCGAR